jgi:hypothetical protein
MTEAGGPIVAAIIAGIVTIVAAIIGAFVSFLSLIISKEQSVSQFRQEWIDELRKDIAIVVGRVIAMHGESIAKQKENQDELWARLKGDFTGFNRVIVRIRLRLNPNEKGKKEGPATKAVLDTLEKLESMFASAKPRFHELDDLVDTLVDNAQVILKENWDRVREGEEGYQRAKSWALIAIRVCAVIGVIVAIFYGFRWFKVICPWSLHG